MIKFKSRKRTIVALLSAPLLVIPVMTIIDMIFILMQDGSYMTTEMGQFEMFFTNLFLYLIVFSPISYLITFLLFLPTIYLIRNNKFVNLSHIIGIGAVIGFITPLLIKSAFYMLQLNSEDKVPYLSILPSFTNIERAEPYITSTITGAIVVFVFWVAGGITTDTSGRFIHTSNTTWFNR